MIWLSILYFFIIFPLLGWGFFHLISLKFKQPPLFKKYFLISGIGFSLFPLITLLLDFLRIPLFWWLYLAIALVIPFIYILTNNTHLKFEFKHLFRKLFGDIQFLLMLIIFFIFLFFMLKGAFFYPYLEDDDSWSHALAAKYVAVEKDLRPEPGVLHYLNPYPPAYAALMGILHQTNDSIYWTLKFFNALIVALTIPFFYFLANLIFENKNKALFSTFVLVALPSFLSHFIWAHSLVILYILIGLYWMLYSRRKQEITWKISLFILPVVISAIFLTQITQAIKFSILFIALIFISYLVRKKINWKLLLGGLIGIIISMFWWGLRAFGVLTKHQASAVAKGKSFILANNIGTSSRAYKLTEFLFPPHKGLVTNPIGIGWVVCILVIIGILAVILTLIFKWKQLSTNKKEVLFFLLFFFVFTFLGVNSVTFNLPVGLFAFRFWMLLAIPVALLSASGLWALIWVLRKSTLIKKVSWQISVFILSTIVVFVLIGIIFTSAYPKYSINITTWPAGVLWDSPKELAAFIKLREQFRLDIFPACKDGFKKLIGNDQFACAWCKDQLAFQEKIFNKSPQQIADFLKANNYDALIVETSCLQLSSEEIISKEIDKLLNSGLFLHNQNFKKLFVLNLR